MASVNKCQILGNLGKDVEVRQTNSGTTAASFPVATSEKWNDKNNQKQEKTEWHNIVAWGKLGEIAAKYLKKGASVFVDGKITTNVWEDKEGKKNYRTEIVARDIQFLDSQNGSQNGSDESAGNGSSSAEQDDLPF